MPALSDAAARYLAWFTGRALPLWSARGWDEARGGFHEALTFEGDPAPGDVRRVRVQARQIHTFAESRLAGWAPEGGDLARRGFEYFLAACCPDEGARGCVHRIAPDGTVLDDRRDLYDQAFLLLACASMWRLDKAPRALDLARKTLAFLDDELASPAGGFAEDDRGSLPRRQNPHMHLFEAFLALYAATGEAAFLKRADAVHALFTARFFDARAGVLREFFTQDWSPAPGKKGETIEPGHMVEWVWLLEQYAAAGGPEARRRAGPVQRALYREALARGREPRGFLVDSVGPQADGGRRLWPQTEFLRAALLLARKHGAGAGEGAAGEDAAALIGALFETYLDQPVAGLWTDRYDGAGAPAAADVPASILYHLFSAARETARHCEPKDESK